MATYGFELGSGRIALTTGYNYNKTKVDFIAPNPASLAAIDPTAVRIGRTEIGRITEGNPRDKLFLGGQWKVGDWALAATATRYGTFSVFDNNPALDQKFDAKWTLDLSTTYALGNWDFTVGGDNVLDEYPEEVVFANSTGGQLPYSSVSPFGFNGAFVYGRVGFKW